MLPMVKEFYESNAVNHNVPEEILARTFEAAVTENNMLDGFLLCDEESVVGFAYLTCFYACEVGGITVMLEEIFMKEECRGKGYGSQFFDWMIKEYEWAARIRLEVTEENTSAIHFYEKYGFQFLDYRQMILDRPME